MRPKFYPFLIVLVALVVEAQATITLGLYRPSDIGYTSPIATCTFDECASCRPAQTRSCSFNYDFRDKCTEIGTYVGRTTPTALHTIAGPRNIFTCGCRNSPADMGDCPDQYVCSGNMREYRDYSCSATGACSIWTLISSENCENNEANYCQGGTYFINEWGCASGNCDDAAVPDTPAPLEDDDGDGFDNRCDSFDSDPCSISSIRDNCNNVITGQGCMACVVGSVKDADGNNISGAFIQIIGTPYTATSSAGTYAIAPTDSGSYTMSASKSPFTPTILPNTQISPSAITQVDFVLGTGPSMCESDCTYLSDSLCHQDCWGTNGCTFYDSIAASTCNSQASGFRLPYGGGQEIQCCTGSPYMPAKIKATTEIDSSNVVRIVKIALYEGKLIKIVIDVFD